MSRTVREIENNIIKILSHRISSENKNRITSSKKKIFFNPEVYSVIEKSKIYVSDKYLFSPIGMIIFDDKKYLFVPDKINDDEVLKKFKFIYDQDLLYGFAMIMICEKVIVIKDTVTDYEIIDSVLGWENDQQFFCKDVLCFFEKFYVYEFDYNDFDLSYYEDFSRLECSLFCCKYIESYNQKEYLSALFDVLSLKSSRSIINMVFNIFHTTSEKLIFLQLYQMLEYLFVVQRANDISERYDIPLEKIIKLIDDEGIRMPENISVKKLVEACSDKTIIDNYMDYITTNNVFVQKENNNFEKIADYIYKTRCRIAHYKLMHEDVEDDELLIKSNHCLLKLILHLYGKYDETINYINSNFFVWRKIISDD